MAVRMLVAIQLCHYIVACTVGPTTFCVYRCYKMSSSTSATLASDLQTPNSGEYVRRYNNIMPRVADFKKELTAVI